MLKRVAKFINASCSLDKNKKNTHPKNKINKKKSTTKTALPIKNKKEKSLKYLKVFNIDKHPHLLYKKNGNFFIRDLSGKKLLAKIKNISIVNNFGFNILSKDLSEINIAQVEGQLILSYKREYNKKLVTVFAESSDSSNFKEIAIAKDIKYKLIFSIKDLFQEKYISYTGENFIYFATAKSLSKWDVHKEYLLTPRQNYFDHNGVKIIESVSLSEGIFLLYESSFVQDDLFYLQIGGVLFEKNDPKKLIWRSEYPIW
jgi:hypothetical protein